VASFPPGGTEGNEAVPGCAGEDSACGPACDAACEPACAPVDVADTLAAGVRCHGGFPSARAPAWPLGEDAVGAAVPFSARMPSWVRACAMVSRSPGSARNRLISSAVALPAWFGGTTLPLAAE